MATILLVLAHPDDESFVAGGTLCLYGKRDVRTVLLTVTDGEAGRLGPEGEPPLATRETIARVRREELRRAAGILGIDEIVTPGWPDGKLREISDAKGARLVSDALHRFRPEVVITFGPEGGGSGHEDHAAVSRWTTRAFRGAAGNEGPEGSPPQKLYWITWPPSLDKLRARSGAAVTSVIEIGREIAQRKLRAFAEHRTQEDHRELHRTIVEGFGEHEHFHLAASRVGEAAGLERELFARVAPAEP